MGAESRVVVESFLDGAKAAFAGSRIPVGAATGDVARLLLPSVLRRAIAAPAFRFMSIPPWHRGLPIPVGALAAALGPVGVPVHVWTIDDARAARAFWRIGVRGVVSNDPGSILRARDEAGRSPGA